MAIFDYWMSFWCDSVLCVRNQMISCYHVAGVKKYLPPSNPPKHEIAKIHQRQHLTTECHSVTTRFLVQTFPSLLKERILWAMCKGKCINVFEYLCICVFEGWQLLLPGMTRRAEVAQCFTAPPPLPLPVRNYSNVTNSWSICNCSCASWLLSLKGVESCFYSHYCYSCCGSDCWWVLSHNILCIQITN